MKAPQVYQWIANHELPEGGIEAWDTARMPYPEISGYIIPSLIDYGAINLAKRLADWLLTQQDKDGAWRGLDGNQCVFDSSAIVEGLQRAYDEFGDERYYTALELAKKWIYTLILPDGSLARNPRHMDSTLYTARAASIIGYREGVMFWRSDYRWPYIWGLKQRAHYLAYLMEGLYNIGEKGDVTRLLGWGKETIIDGLMPMWISDSWKVFEGSDMCATIQWALMFLKMGDKKTAYKMIDAVDAHMEQNGGIWQSLDDHRQLSWCAKYYLDFYNAATVFD